MNSYVEGIAQSIVRAFDSLEPGSISMAKDRLWDANINRSPTSYLLNPETERGQYADEGDTDKTMLQLSFSSQTDNSTVRLKGLLNWFAVHGTSMNSSNLVRIPKSLISSSQDFLHQIIALPVWIDSYA